MITSLLIFPLTSAISHVDQFFFFFYVLRRIEMYVSKFSDH